MEQESGFLPAMMATMAVSLKARMASSLVQPVASSLAHNWRSIQENWKSTSSWISCIISITSNEESSVQRHHKSNRGYNKVDNMDTFFFSSAPSFK